MTDQAIAEDGDFHLSIGVTVSGAHDSEYVHPLVVDAVAELLHTRDFHKGTMRTGHVVRQEMDFGRIVVTTEVNYGRRNAQDQKRCDCGQREACSNCMPTRVLTEGDAQADLDGTRRPDNHID